MYYYMFLGQPVNLPKCNLHVLGFAAKFWKNVMLHV